MAPPPVSLQCRVSGWPSLSARHWYLPEQRADDLLGGDALEFGFGGKNEAMAQYRTGHNLQVVGNDIVAALDCCLSLSGRQPAQRSARAGAKLQIGKSSGF